MFHLPDIPNAGYSTAREKELTDMIMVFMRDVERNRLRLLTIVIEGKDRWRKVAGDIWRSHRIAESPDLVDGIYDYFLMQAARPNTQRILLACAKNPDKWKQVARAVMPHLERERERLRLQQKWSA